MIKKCRKCFLLLLSLFLLWFAGFIAFNYHIYHYKIDDTTITEAIIVLTGGKNRIIKGGSLYNQGLGQKLFISGVGKDVSLQEIETSNAIQINQKSEVHLGVKAKDTIGNALETKEWLEENNIKSIRLVTSNYHMPRSLLEFESIDKDLSIIAHPVYSDNVKKKWWKRPGSFYLIASEYNKFVYTYIKKKILKI